MPASLYCRESITKTILSEKDKMVFVFYHEMTMKIVKK